MTTKHTKARAFAPASVANVAVGFDLLGFSASITGDTATVEKIAEPRVEIGEITGLPLKLPTNPLENTATAGLVRLVSDLKLSHGFRVSIEKGIPLGSGLGGSAASAVAALVAANALLEKPLSKNELLSYALIGEKVASQSVHADNIAPSLFGGFTLASITSKGEAPGSKPMADVVELPIPEDLWCVLLHPHVSVETKAARGILKKELPLSLHIQASAHLAHVVAALYRGDFEMLQYHMKDIVIEPQRAHLIPGFHEIQKAALSLEETLGCTISGAGPSIFALAKGQHAALRIKDQMTKASNSHGPSTSWAFALKNEGARLLPGGTPS